MAKQLRAQFSAFTLFLQEWLQKPHQIGAIAPSSRNLAGAMADWLPADPNEFVLELGPGTGSVTQALLERGLRQDRLIAIEKSPKLAKLLRDRYPFARIITGDACELDELLRKNLKADEHVGAIISSLPLRNFPAEKAELLIGKIQSSLRSKGKWVQFSYYLGKQRPQGAASFDLVDSSIVWLNLPPARVNVFQK